MLLTVRKKSQRGYRMKYRNIFHENQIGNKWVIRCITRCIGIKCLIGARLEVRIMNLSYCRFQNTYEDLKDCYENWDYTESEEEEEAKIELLELCKKIVEEHEED